MTRHANFQKKEPQIALQLFSISTRYNTSQFFG